MKIKKKQCKHKGKSNQYIDWLDDYFL
jgi:hypothetical protein